jgi:hypothetical protein
VGYASLDPEVACTQLSTIRSLEEKKDNPVDRRIHLERDTIQPSPEIHKVVRVPGLERDIEALAGEEDGVVSQGEILFNIK